MIGKLSLWIIGPLIFLTICDSILKEWSDNQNAQENNSEFQLVFKKILFRHGFSFLFLCYMCLVLFGFSEEEQ